jgi:integrase
MRQRLTKRFVDAIEKPAAEEWHTDTDVPGFCLRVTPAGAKLYVVRYRYAGKARKLPIGRHGQVTVEQARQKARDVFAALAAGRDPAVGAGDGPTVAELRKKYEKEHSDLHKKPRSRAADRALWNNHIIPAMGQKSVRALTRADVLELHIALQDRPYVANRALALISHALKLAELWHWRDEGSNPCRNIKRYREEEREVVLNPEELARLLAELDNTERQRLRGLSVVPMVRLLLLTGCRQSEIRTARWEWVDFERGVLSLPDSKGGKKDVELPPQAVDMLRAMRAVDKGDWIVPGHVRNSHMVSPARPWHAICKRAKLPAMRLHDLRHTYGTMASLSGLSLREVADLLGHKSTVSTMRYVNAANWKKKGNSAKVAEAIYA